MFPAGRFPKWAYIDMWAPEIRLVNGNYYVYYTGRKRSGSLKIKVWLRRKLFDISSQFELF